MRPDRTTRRGFTLPELLVSLALIIFIMSILAQGFSAATKVVRDTRAAADLAERLAGVMGLMRRDLRAQHLDNPTRRLGDDSWVPSRPSNKGFFRISQYGRPTPLPARPATPPPGWQQVPDSTTLMPDEGTPGVVSMASLHFTSRLPGLYPTDFYAATIPTQVPPEQAPPNLPTRSPFFDWTTPQDRAEQERRYQRPIIWPPPPPPPVVYNFQANHEYRQQWAEIVWWLAPSSGDQSTQDPDTTGTATEVAGQQLYTLRRRQRLLWDDAANKVPLPWVTMPDANYRDVSLPSFTSMTATPPATYHANTTSTVTVPALRYGASPTLAQYFNPNVPVGPAPPLPSYVNDPVWAGLPANVAAPYSQSDEVPDIVLSDVLSMDVRVLLDDGSFRKEFVHLGDPIVQRYSMGNPACNPGSGGTKTPLYLFDTWTNHDQSGKLDYQARDSLIPTHPDFVQRWERRGTASCVPLYKNAADQVIKIRAIQVTVRLWDVKTGFTRQVTIIQDL